MWKGFSCSEYELFNVPMTVSCQTDILVKGQTIIKENIKHNLSFSLLVYIKVLSSMLCILTDNSYYTATFPLFKLQRTPHKASTTHLACLPRARTVLNNHSVPRSPRAPEFVCPDCETLILLSRSQRSTKQRQQGK